MVIIKTNKQLNKEDFFKKSLKLGYNDIAFALEFGYSTEFIGELIPVAGCVNEYRFCIDKVQKKGAVSFVKSLGVTDDEEKTVIMTALKEDYHMDDVVIDMERSR